MQITQDIYCPNCGSRAKRRYCSKTHITQTQCPACDYLMVNCSRTGRVVEAYAPGIYASR
ncbi:MULTISPECIES: replication restart DNA helicase PriA [unclassified Coleofasciculus]|uniref:replication restart DNA helicase PriA n=1 Tax=unclassified Coleofasciculus TaxID=2692782 RepID=UPI001880CB68|nr:MULTISPECIES: replication restart DNA helicase PriA [unclassified Coleofasciculus]MBE9127726.1 replication restart DNA helicase PriA [Coleofasciculus sp. LEGE 07081]MBE9149684.1 replication restart DNA helicase PriA [Coleofasciculus sp. LEGE 07092]